MNLLKALRKECNQGLGYFILRMICQKKEYEIFTFKMLGDPYQIIDKSNDKKFEYHYYYPEKGFSGAEMLANDKVFDGKTLKERWNSVVFISED